MTKCPKCKRKLIPVFHGEPNDEMAVQSMNGEITIGNCCSIEHNYYCEYCDEFFNL